MIEKLQKQIDELGLEVVIGLETHVTVTATATKLFCGCANCYNLEPNTDICPICTGQMGTLPMVNQAVVTNAIILSQAIQGKVSSILTFDRKHYSYPDLPKGFQTTQLRHPISTGGLVKFYRPDNTQAQVEISHFHIEEDPAKLIHNKNYTLVDYNRSGKPLFEIVTAPSIHALADAMLYMEQLQKIVRYLGISDADMEKGQFKSDVSVSLRPKGTNYLNPRTEIKNMNSFAFALDALAVEVQYQLDYYIQNKGFKPEQQTKGRDEANHKLIVMRDKETVADYKFMAEPDIPTIYISDLINDIYAKTIKTPFEVENILVDAGLSYREAMFFSENKTKADILFAIVGDDNNKILSVAKFLANLSGNRWYDSSVHINKIIDIYGLTISEPLFTQGMAQTVIDRLADSANFDYKQYISDHIYISDEIKNNIKSIIKDNMQIGSIIGAAIKEGIVSKEFSRTALLQYISSLVKGGDENNISDTNKSNNISNIPTKTNSSIEKKEYIYNLVELQNIYRTHHHSQLDENIVGQNVTVAGWIQSIRDHGDLVFVDLRCESEILQIQIDVSRFANIKEISSWNDESVISVTGQLILRQEDDINSHTRLGKIEVKASSISLLSGAQHTPFQVTQSHKVNESKRMEYRYLDLRNPIIANNIIQRHKMIKYIRDYFDNNGFVHVDTPILGKPSDEGSREFVVPSRLHPHQFYTLPQAPQQLKQIMMGSGIDKYYQVARCFRDEDPKGDRQPEFTQIDLEMAYVKQEDIINLVGSLVVNMIKDLYPNKNIISGSDIPHYEYDYVMEHYSIDKPDLRYGLKMNTITDLVQNSGFQIFDNVIKSGGIVKCMRVEGGQNMFTKKYLDVTLREFVTQMGGGGLANFHVGGEMNFIEEKLGKDIVQKIIDRTGAQNGDTLLFAANHEEIVHSVLSSVRSKIATDYKLYKPDDIYLLWVVNFPMFEKTDTGAWKFTHNPFSMPHIQDLANHISGQNISDIKAQQYDIVMNGNEIGGGSIRAHLPHLLEATYRIMGYSEAETKASVGHMIEAFGYGFPPHGGLALGLERILMILQGHSTIREVIPFPKTGDGKDLLMKAPAPLSDEAMKNAHIKLD